MGDTFQKSKCVTTKQKALTLTGCQILLQKIPSNYTSQLSGALYVQEKVLIWGRSGFEILETIGQKITIFMKRHHDQGISLLQKINNFFCNFNNRDGIGFTQRANYESLSHECVTLLIGMVPNVHVINCCLRRKLELSSNRLQCFCNFEFIVVYSHYHASCCLTITLMVKI